MSYLKKILPGLFLLVIFGLVIFYLEPPKSWNEASFLQWILFYLPIFLFFSYLFQFYFKYYLKSFTLGLGITVLIILYGLDLFSLLTIFVTVGFTLFLLKVIKTPDQYEKVVKSPRVLRLKRQ